MPRVAVVIPCFNQGHCVDEAIQSVLAQSFQDIEIIVVNDGSTQESSQSILRQSRWEKTRILHTDNQGLAAARNNGIALAQGSYILPLDADDRLAPTYIEKAVTLLDEQPRLGIVYCRAWLFGHADTEWLLPKFSVEQMLLDNCIFCAALFRRQDWQQVGGYDSTLRLGWEDYDFWLSLLELGREVYQIPEILFYYRVAADSMVRARPRQHKVDTFARIFRKHQSLYARHIEVWVDKVLAAGAEYHQAALFPAQGRAEDFPQWVRKVDTSTTSLNFQLPPEFQGGPYIFQPAQTFVILRFKAVSLSDSLGQVPYTHNADREEQGRCFFCSPGPLVYLNLPAAPRARFVTIELEYLAFGQDCIPHLHHLCQQKPKTFTQAKAMRFIQRHIKTLRYLYRHSSYQRYRRIQQSRLFDPVYYLQDNADIDPKAIDPLIHYLEYGWKEERKPHPLFENHWYRETYGIAEEPLWHYLSQGWREGKRPNPLFDTSYYLQQVSGEVEPLADYLHQGWQEGKNPHPLFDTTWYMQRYPDVADSGLHPFIHYYVHGSHELRFPMPLLDLPFYCERNPSVQRQWRFPLLHFWEHGDVEEQSPHPFFDPLFYREENQLKDMGPVALFLHYVSTGRWQGLAPAALFDPQFYCQQYAEVQNSGLSPLEHYQDRGAAAGYSPCAAVAALTRKVRVSILTPVYNTNEDLLCRCISSVRHQVYPHWELCLVDDGSSAPHIRPLLESFAAKDPRIRIQFVSHNQGIAAATNQAAALAQGEYLAFLDHDDELHFDALYHVVEAINRLDPDALYSDEELIDWKGSRCSQFYKSDMNPELLLCHNCLTHFFVLRTCLFQELGGLDPAYTGAQDYDLALKVSEQSRAIHHIRRPIYRWRATDSSTSINHASKDYAHTAGLHAVQAALHRRGLAGEVASGQWNYYYKVRRRVEKKDSLSILVPLRRFNTQLQDWLHRLMELSPWPQLEIHLLHWQPLSEPLHEGVQVHACSPHESEAAALNRLVALSQGTHLLFLEQGLLPQHQDWLEVLLGYSQEPDCGVVTGWVLGPEGEENNLALPQLHDPSCQALRDHLLHGSVHLNGLHCSQNVLVASFACGMVKRSAFTSVQGLNAATFPRVLYDLDFCLRLRASGKEHVFTPQCRVQPLYPVQDAPNPEQGLEEKISLQKIWSATLLHHPYYNEQRLLLEQGLSRQEWEHWLTGSPAGTVRDPRKPL
jgi:glycosyltransferase involved in cell wall biosynthesis